MKKFCLFGLMMLAGSGAWAQWAIPAQMRAENTLDRLSDFNGLANSDILYGLPLPAGTVVGDTYLDKKWNAANILLYQSEALIEGYLVKYDIKSNLVEIKTVAGIKVLDAKKVRSMVWKDSLTLEPHFFVNGQAFKRNGIEMSGLVEVLVDGNSPLVKKTEVYLKKPTYNPALDVGTRDTRIFQKHAYYAARNGELTEIKSKADVLAAAGDRAAALESFIKENKLNVNKEPGMKKAFEFINQP